MQTGFEYYRAFPQDPKDNIELAATANLTKLVLVPSGDIYPALGGDIPGSMTLNSIQSLASFKCARCNSSIQDTGFQKNDQISY
jgi:hypothetical protein